MPIRAIKRPFSTPPEPTLVETSDSDVAPVARKRIRAVSSTAPETAVEGVSVPPPSAPPKRAHHVVDRTGDNWDENGDYLVGRNRPPSHTQWKKGQSGNPRGPKPKEKLDPLSEFERELTADFTARVNGADVQLNTGTFVLQLLKASAAKGTVKAQQLLLDHFLAAVRREADRDGTPEVLAWEQQVIDQMLETYGLPERPVVRRERASGSETNTHEEGEQ